MHYQLIKDIHLLAVYTSLTLFTLRGLGMLADGQWYRRGLWRVVPHVVDSVLLVAGVSLAVLSAQYPGAQGWLTAKLLALVAYILVGSIALRHGARKARRVAAFFGALALFAYMLGVAYGRSPLSWGVLLLG